MGEASTSGFGAATRVEGVARLNGLVEHAEITAARAPLGEIGEATSGVDVGGLVGLRPTRPSRGPEGTSAAPAASETEAGPASLTPVKVGAEPSASVAMEGRGDAAVEVRKMAV